MPASDISRLSTPRVDTAATIAKQITNLQIKYKLQSGELRRDDEIAFKRAYETIYHEEYYKLYRLLEDQASTSRIIYLPTDNPAAKKFYCRHSAVRFTRTNLLIRVQNSRIIISRFKYPINSDKSPETKEAFIKDRWPGPLDRDVKNLTFKITEYIDILKENDSDRKIRYCSNDEQRITILKLLKELLIGNGTISAQKITKLLVKSEQSEIPKDDTYRRPLEILQRYLLSGRLIDAIEHAKSKNLFDHCYLLSVVEDYLNETRDHPVRLEDKRSLQATDHFINTLTEHKILNIVYRSFLNKILQHDADSNEIIKYNVGNNAYEFALFSANNLAMDFDQSNEIFKLVSSIKQTTSNPTINNHLISLGFVGLDSDNSEDSSFRSHSSFNVHEDTYSSRTLRISNIDMLVFNEIWEYCLNLARGSCNPTSYRYLIDLVPYKLVFAAKLFDFGLYDMFADYLNSMQMALTKAKQDPYLERDLFYDWNTIEQSVEHLAEVWRLFQGGDYTRYPQESSSLVQPPQMKGYDTQDQFNSVPYPIHNPYQTEQIDSAPTNDYTSLPYQDNLHAMQNNPIQSFNQLSLQDEPNPFDPDPLPAEEDYNQQQLQHNQQHQLQHNQQHQFPHYETNQSYANDYSNDVSRRTSVAPSQSMEMPIFSPPGFAASSVHERQIHKTMTSSSPVDKNRDSLQDGHHKVGESFNTPYSPINEYNDIPTSPQTSTSNNINHQLPSQQQQSSSSNTNENQLPSRAGENTNNANSNNKLEQQQSAGDQQTGFINNIFGMLKKSSSSKQMVLPDDTKQNIIWDKDKQAWVDITNPDDSNAIDQNDAPPVTNIPSNIQPPTYSFQTRSSKSRYPKRGF